MKSKDVNIKEYIKELLKKDLLTIVVSVDVFKKLRRLSDHFEIELEEIVSQLVNKLYGVSGVSLND